MKKIFPLIISFIISFQLFAQQIYPSADKVIPLKVNDTVPNFELPNETNELVNFKQKLNEKPVVLIFYRAGWCPYCNVHLSDIQSIESKILKLGYQIIAISTDRPDKLNETKNKNSLNYTLLSDPNCEIAAKFGIAFWAGENWKLPVPSLFIIEKSGKIKFVHTDADYKQRISATDVLSILKK